jgi:uncharacterized protein YqhQ
MKKTCSPCENDPRLGKVGGQAVLEGVMMRSGENLSVSVRAEDGSVQTKDSKFVSVKQKYKILGLPIIRGMVSFIESMIMSFSTMNDSVDLLGIEEEETKFEKWLKKKFGASILDVLMPVALFLGVVLALGLFVFLPALAGRGVSYLFGGDIGVWQSVVEGVVKVVIFVVYMLLVSLMKDIRRTFEYHGAEHKSIFCYESGEELTVENVRKHSRFHPRCGTSFMFVMIFIGIVLGFFIPFETVWLRTLCKILLLPVTMGFGYEFLMYAGRHDNFLIRALSAPGLWMQRITTKEPDDKQIEVAIASLRHALPDDFPDREELRLRLEAEAKAAEDASAQENEA